MAFRGPQDWPPHASAPYTFQSLGYFQVSLASGTGAQTLAQLAAAATVPLTNIAGLIGPDGPARVCVVLPESAAIRWLDDGQKPTTTYGSPVAAGAAIELTGDLGALQIAAQSGTATVNVWLGC